MAKSSGFLGKTHADKTRQKIKVTQIVNRLNKLALGEIEDVPAQQLRAAEILLKKALPDLSSIQQDFTSSDGSMSQKPTEIILNGVRADADADA